MPTWAWVAIGVVVGLAAGGGIVAWLAVRAAQDLIGRRWGGR